MKNWRFSTNISLYLYGNLSFAVVLLCFSIFSVIGK